jgi:hypothetical protein
MFNDKQGDQINLTNDHEPSRSIFSSPREYDSVGRDITLYM